MNKFEKLFEEFGVRDEIELSYKLLEVDCHTLPCQGGCGREILIDAIYFVDGDPYCKDCLEMDDDS